MPETTYPVGVFIDHSITGFHVVSGEVRESMSSKLTGSMWITRRENRSIHVIGAVSFPLGATTSAAAVRELRGSMEDAVAFVEKVYSGEGSPLYKVPTQRYLANDFFNMYKNAGFIDTLTEQEAIAAFYSLYLGLHGLHGVAPALAHQFGLTIRTAHDRISKAKQAYLI